MPRLEPILDLLHRSHRELLRSADAVPADHWRTPPREGAWCAGEIVAHLIMVERTVTSAADRITRHDPLRVPLFRRWRLPLALAEARLIRRKTPIPLDPDLVGNKEEMFAGFRAARERTLAFIDETRSRDLSAYRWNHAFLGCLDAYDWLELLGRHELRHCKQIQEITVALPKVVATLEK
jgi:hypothetical protein